MANLVTLKEAQEHIGVSKTTMGKLVREGRFTIYEDPSDGRKKLVDLDQVTAAMQPRQVTPARGPDDKQV